MTLESFALELVAKHAPRGWRLSYEKVCRREDQIEIYGALEETMHFGRVLLDLATGATSYTDEDHRDGGDFCALQTQLDATDLARLRELAQATTN